MQLVKAYQQAPYFQQPDGAGRETVKTDQTFSIDALGLFIAVF